MSIYEVNAGFFPTPIEVCFSSKEFFNILKKYGIPDYLFPEIAPLEKGIAETYAFSNKGEAFVVAIFNIEEVAYDMQSMAGIVAHESVHICERIFEHVGEDDGIGEETRAYLMEHLVEQIFQACIKEIHKYAKRKGNRKASGKDGKGKEGDVSEVGEPEHDGGPGQGSPVQLADTFSGVKGPKGKAISATDVFIWPATGDRDKGPRTSKRGRG